jgi:hypothetical protein
MNYTDFQLFIVKHNLKYCKFQPSNDYREWYIDNQNTLYVFSFSFPLDEPDYCLTEKRINHKDIKLIPLNNYDPIKEMDEAIEMSNFIFPIERN